MKVEIEPQRCIGSGQCVLIAGGVFDQNDDDGLVVLRTATVPPGQEDAVRSAAEICPAQAIRLAQG